MEKMTVLCFGITFILSAPARAETCIEPVKPEAMYLHGAGFSGDEIHAEFKNYFKDVENFLNCWNQVTYRIHEEAKAASDELAMALRKYPSHHDHSSALQGLNGFAASEAPLIDTGSLVLSTDDRENDKR